MKCIWKCSMHNVGHFVHWSMNYLSDNNDNHNAIFSFWWSKELISCLWVIAVTPQTPKCHHNQEIAEVVVTFGCLWCHGHGWKEGMTFFSFMVSQSLRLIGKCCQARCWKLFVNCLSYKNRSVVNIESSNSIVVKTKWCQQSLWHRIVDTLLRKGQNTYNNIIKW